MLQLRKTPRRNRKKNRSVRDFPLQGRHGWLLIPVFLFLILITYLRTLNPLFTQHIVVYVLRYSDQGSRLPAFLFRMADAEGMKNPMLLAVVLMVAVDIVRALAIIGRRITSAVFAERVTFDLRNHLYRKLQNLGYFVPHPFRNGGSDQRCTRTWAHYQNFIKDQIVELPGWLCWSSSPFGRWRN